MHARKGSCTRITVYAYNRVHRYTQSMDTDECLKVNWITEQESERLLCLLDLTPDLDKVLLALRLWLRGGDGKFVLHQEKPICLAMANMYFFYHKMARNGFSGIFA